MLNSFEENFYSFLNLFFFVFHFLLILFNLFGWLLKRLRKWHLASMIITAFSWFVLGIFYGWGYCFLTDWHYRVRDMLNLKVDSNSYIHFLLKRLGLDFWSEQITDILTAVLFIVLFLLSILLYVRDKKQQESKQKKPSR